MSIKHLLSSFPNILPAFTLQSAITSCNFSGNLNAKKIYIFSYQKRIKSWLNLIQTEATSLYQTEVRLFCPDSCHTYDFGLDQTDNSESKNEQS